MEIGALGVNYVIICNTILWYTDDWVRSGGTAVSSRVQQKTGSDNCAGAVQVIHEFAIIRPGFFETRTLEKEKEKKNTFFLT